MDGRDRYAVVAGPVSRMGLQRPERFPQGIPVARLDMEEQAELVRRADADARPGPSGCRCCHRFLPWTRPAFRARATLACCHGHSALTSDAVRAPRWSSSTR